MTPKKNPQTFRRDVQRQMALNIVQMSLKQQNPLPGDLGHGLIGMSPY